MNSVKKINRVVFVQKFVPHYRLPLFEALRSKLEAKGIEFVLVYGQPDPYEGSKIKMMFPEWGTRVKSLIIPLPGRYLYWQWAPFKVRKGDVVIVEHASKLLDNYFIFLLEQLNFVHMCYFGHGRNFQDAHELWLAKVIKKLMLKRVSRWFAYTDMSKDSLLDQGVDVDIITTINNTLIHNTALSEAEVTRETHTLTYIGGLYADKRIEFLLEAAEKVKKRVPEFNLRIIGTGPLKEMVENFAETHSWCHYEGEVYGDDRDRMLFESTGIAMPGLVGLVAVDSFHFACPILSTNCGQHSPEVAYLEHGENALILSDEGTTDTYADMVCEFLTDRDLNEKLRQGCRDGANTYTIDDTADRFVDGILKIKSS